MLQRVLGVQPKSVSVETLTGIADSQLPEGQTLEFISELPARGPSGEADFLREVTGMVNGGGGIIIYGIAEDRNRADSPNPVPLKGVENRLRQLIVDRIGPRITFNVITVGDESGFLIVELPTSMRVPHCYSTKTSRYEYPIRYGTDRRYMNPDEIAQRYRSQFRRLEEVTEGLKAKVIGSLARHPPGGHARVYVGTIPVEDHGRLFAVMDRFAVASLQVPPDFLGRFPILPPEYRPGFQCVTLFGRIGAPGTPDFLEFGTDGSFVRSVPSDRPKTTSHPAVFGDFELAGGIVAAVESLHFLQNHFDVAGPSRIIYGIDEKILPASLQQLEQVGHDSRFVNKSAVEGQLEAEVSNATPRDRIRIAKVIADDLFTAFGQEGCEFLTHEGLLNKYGSLIQYHRTVEEWNAQALKEEPDRPGLS